MAVGAALGPAVASAASNLVEIVGPGGSPASVSRAGQLKVTEAGARALQGFQDGGVLGSGGCDILLRGIRGKAFVMTQWTISVGRSGNPPEQGTIALFTDRRCAGDEVTEASLPAGPGVYTIPFRPGFAVRAGHALYVAAQPGSGSAFNAHTFVYGYTVPPSEVRHTTTTPAP